MLKRREATEGCSAAAPVQGGGGRVQDVQQRGDGCARQEARGEG
jgi:hypothetical protein